MAPLLVLGLWDLEDVAVDMLADCEDVKLDGVSALCEVSWCGADRKSVV